MIPGFTGVQNSSLFNISLGNSYTVGNSLLIGSKNKEGSLDENERE